MGEKGADMETYMVMLIGIGILAGGLLLALGIALVRAFFRLEKNVGEILKRVQDAEKNP